MSDIVRMRIRGLMPERLIERANALGVHFKAISPRKDHQIIVSVNARDAETLSGLCRRYSIPCKVLSRRGRSALTAWFLRRWTLAVGLLTMLGVCWLFLGHIWRIDIAFTGDAAALGDAGRIAAALHEIGIHPGAPRHIDARLISQELMARCDGLSYAGARVEGVRLVIEAAPESETPEVYALEAARDLYADRTGIVVSVNVESGVACVHPGDAVRRGQPLILGEERVSRDETRRIAALGEVIVRTWFEGEARGALIADRTEFTGRSASASTLVTPWLDIPVTEGEIFAHQAESTDRLPIGGMYLPVRLERVTRRETRIDKVRVDEATLQRRLAALALADARARLSAQGPREYEIARAWTRKKTEGNTLRVSAVLEITTNTAVPIDSIHQGG